MWLSSLFPGQLECPGQLEAPPFVPCDWNLQPEVLPGFEALRDKVVEIFGGPNPLNALHASRHLGRQKFRVKLPHGLPEADAQRVGLLEVWATRTIVLLHASPEEALLEVVTCCSYSLP